jgi:hypothetical protein
VEGIDSDHATLHKEGKDGRDLFQLQLGQIVSSSMGSAAATNLTPQVHTIDGRDVTRVHGKPCCVRFDGMSGRLL